MLQPALNWLRTLNDPLRNVVNAEQWIAALPVNDVMAVQKEALDLVAAFPGVRTEIATAAGRGAAQGRRPARAGDRAAHAQYTANYQKSSAIESRLWHAVFDLVKAFTTAYGLCLKAGYPSADNKRWRAVLPWVLVRLAHYKGLDGKYRLFRYGHWIPAQWREFHELYEFARMRGWQREQLVFGAGAFAPARRLRRARLPADAAADAPRLRQLHARPGRVGRAPARGLVAVADAGAAAGRPARNFYVDLTGNRGPAPPGQAVGGRADPVPRRRPDLQPRRRADALAARAGRRRGASPASCRCASSACC